ncbi:hypothetical protein CW705_04510 [Candidatus Bathyarchaeota archaeon]|nr:MAG: hypothetical protein CW705_04510 [Candidatus Bathyarchaeota archaeon]
MANDLYGREKRLKKLLNEVRPILRRYVIYLKLQGLGIARQLKHLENVTLFERRNLKGRRLESVSFKMFRKAFEKFILSDKLDNDTKYVYRISLKKFYEFLLKENNGKERKRKRTWKQILNYLKEIKIKSTEPDIEVLTEDEFRRLYEAAEDYQTRALLSVLYEVGPRVGELLSCRIKDVMVYDSYVEINVSGKTGQGRLIIIKAYRDVVNHLQNHPFKNNPEAPLWYMVRSNRFLPLSYNALRMRIKRLARKTGIKRRIWLHLFRHTAATEKASYLTDREMCVVFRWSKNSRMPAKYAHLAQRNIKEKLLSLYDSNEFQVLKPKTSRCWKCGEILPSEKIRYCPRCGVPLQTNKIYEMIMKRREADDLMDRLMSDPRVRKVISEVLYEMIYSETVEGFASSPKEPLPSKEGKSGGRNDV